MKKLSQKIDQFFSSNKMMQVLKIFAAVFSKLPHLPTIIGNFLITLSPWLALLSGLIGLVAGPLMALLGLLSLVTLKPLIILSYVGSALIMLLNTMLMFKAFKPLKQRDLRGWVYLFWSNILWLINGLLELLTGEQTLITLLISNLISFYLLFEMKEVLVKKGE